MTTEVNVKGILRSKNKSLGVKLDIHALKTRKHLCTLSLAMKGNRVYGSQGQVSFSSLAATLLSNISIEFYCYFILMYSLKYSLFVIKLLKINSVSNLIG